MAEKGYQTNVNPTGKDSTGGGGKANPGPVVREGGMLNSKAGTRPWTPASALSEAQARRNADPSIRKGGR